MRSEGKSGRTDLRQHLRTERRPGEDVVVVRGGKDTATRLAAHAARTHESFELDGEPVWGVSSFCALDDIGPGSLSGLLAGRLVTRRTVHFTTTGALAVAGFGLLPTFRRPHYTIMVPSGDARHFERLLAVLGSPETNPYYYRLRPSRPRRR